MPSPDADPETTVVMTLCDTVRQTGFNIHCYLKHGHLEKVYENALLHRLRKQGVSAIPQFSQTVYDEDGTILGDYFADLFVEARLIVEVKACSCVSAAQEAQLLGYLRASRIRHGLLINFGAPKFQIKKYIL